MTEERPVAPLPVKRPFFKRFCVPAFVLVSVVFFFNLAFLVFHFTRGLGETLSNAVFIPAAIVDGVPVSYHSLALLTNGILAGAPSESHRDAFQAALSRAIENASVVALAHKYKVDVAGTESSASGSSDFDTEYVQKPLLLSQAVEKAVYADGDYQQEEQDRLLDLRGRIENGMPFTDAAKKFSDDVTGASGGDLGVFTLDAIPPWLAPVARVDYGDVSPVLNGPDAYWIASVYEHGGTEEEPWIRLEGIAAKKKGLADATKDELAENPPWVFVW